MEKPETPYNESSRLEILNATKLVETGKESIFDELTDIVKTVFDVPVVAISLVEETRQYFKSIQGLDVKETPRDVSFCGHVVFQNDPMVIPDAYKDLRFADNPLVKYTPYIRFYAGVPIEYTHLNNSYTLGTLCIIDFQPRQLSTDELELLKKFASQVEHIIESIVFNRLTIDNLSLEKYDAFEKLISNLLQQNEVYKSLSEVDDLTNLPNRRFLNSYLDREWFHDLRHQSLSMLLIDLDGFKEINDLNGHIAGDKLLRNVAEVMHEALRFREDIIIRLGGDEFLVVLLDVSFEGSIKVGEKILAAIESVPTLLDNKKLNASIGLLWEIDKSISTENLIKRTDESMYEAKKRGKGRIYSM